MNRIWFALALLACPFAATSETQAATPTEAPPQLNVSGFADCLHQEAPSVDLSIEAKSYGFDSADLLILYLSVYPGKRLPAPLSLLQDKALGRWSRAFEYREADLASRLRSRVGAPEGSLSPSRFFRDALDVCGGSVFCAALISHNVLRTLGRHAQAIYHDTFTGKTHDLNPDWFLSDQELWLIQIPLLQKQLLNLRPDRGGDGWGEWYHFFGILSYSVHELALNQGMAHVDLVVRLNELLNPILAGGPESPEKSRLDRDSARVDWDFLRGEDLVSQASCDERASYVWEASSQVIE